jgi:hypothetical protein
MNGGILGRLSAALLGAVISLSNPAMAFHGGGGFGGGFGGGGMHFGGGGFGGGGMHFGGFAGHGFQGGMVTGRSAFAPGAGFAGRAFAGQRGGMVTGRSAFAPRAGFAGRTFTGQRFAVNRFNNFAFRNRVFVRHGHFRRFAFVGAPFAVGWGWGWGWPNDYAYGGCWQQAWTGYGWQWVNACNGYDYGYGY